MATLQALDHPRLNEHSKQATRSVALSLEHAAFPCLLLDI